jgi:hypothetical protein
VADHEINLSATIVELCNIQWDTYF